MTVKTLIEKLSHYNKNAIVRLHHREGEELLFALASVAGKLLYLKITVMLIVWLIGLTLQKNGNIF